MVGKSLVSIADYSKEDYLKILELAAKFEKNPRQNILQGYVIATLFFEPSTRTRLSFESAINLLHRAKYAHRAQQVQSRRRGPRFLLYSF